MISLASLKDQQSTHRLLGNMTPAELGGLAADIRDRIVETVAANGGHLASNLGAVELTVALHRVFDVAHEPLFFDVGHQSYTHKLLTGREAEFSTLRKNGGLSGFPHPAESPFDPAVAGHSGSALSLALGVSAARQLRGDSGKVLAVIGDASLNNGVSLEALNCAADNGRNLIVILNDNQMSISRNVGAMAHSLSRLITGQLYNRVRTKVKKAAQNHSFVHHLLRRINDILKSVLMHRATVFEELGLRYFGPVNGHDFNELLPLLERIRELEGPVLLHVVTCKGKGRRYSENHPSRYHGVPPFDAESGEIPSGGIETFSAAVGREVVKIAGEDPALAVVSPAMLDGTGLGDFKRLFPERCYDTGIAEEHAVTFTAGLAAGGMVPVCAGYASFMQRALDNIYHDIVLNDFAAVFCFDRAGAVEDGPTHHGFYDLSFIRTLPGMTVMMPATTGEAASMLRYAVGLKKPVILRYPRGGGAVDPELETPPPLCRGKAWVIRRGDESGPVFWSSGREAGSALVLARLWDERYPECRAAVIHSRFITPFDRETEAAFAGRPAVVIEDAPADSGLAAVIAACRSERGEKAPLISCGWPEGSVVPHGNTGELRCYAGLTPEKIFARVAEVLL